MAINAQKICCQVFWVSLYQPVCQYNLKRKGDFEKALDKINNLSFRTKKKQNTKIKIDKFKTKFCINGYFLYVLNIEPNINK